GLNTAYWGFLRVGTTLDIFQNIHILYLEYGVLSLSGCIELYSSVVFATPATAKTKGFLTELGAQVEMQEGLIHDVTHKDSHNKRHDPEVGED
ncbi:hypothetical protein Tco_0310658, partial [Tanacetum coccineum]